uniref:Periviscerokinin-1 n=3 Tax=Acridomorpha TaxID=70910 RepID=PVK1_SCHGR|nr:RecName: Full=Periviscerokinin-1; AltName: Full=Lom-PVK-1 [Locusta migratoria]P84442.1 RecName: Full=Periviscerokinin [Phymateus morbillosus]P85862.1 RecName: Full=Periviscerokinin-1; AltName: Full=Lom-PVK-1 [Schistocerca gregaria]
AAGLFQFPRV